MFSNFGNIFVTRPRHAESTDTRLGIRQHDPEQEKRRKKGEEEKNQGTFDTDDNATVTVEALRVFLENFLKSLEPQQTDGSDHIPSQENLSPQQTTPAHEPRSTVDGEAAKAAGVYQHVAQKVDRTAPPSTPDTPPALSLAAADVRAIHKLLEDLKPLSERGVEYLTIERSDSFLNSLIAAVEKAQNA